MNDSPAGCPESWLSEHGAALYRYALAQTRDAHRAEEVVQDTLLAAFESRSRFAGNASVRTWLISILKHKLIDLFRREARETQLDDPDDLDGVDALLEESFNASGHWRERLAEWGNPEELLERNQFLEILQRCLDALPKRLARLFWLREVMEESTETVCQELTITPTNLWTMLYRTRLRLRECVDQNWVGQV
ncbi:MAG: sigma-70 family RNA polymerase sigma factor [Betaproteobacteria bacterium]|nr:sigma-70 family RNA polymerase sigma factor [Betaproteobacteria bacterium]